MNNDSNFWDYFFLHRHNCHTQDETLYNKRMFEGSLFLVCSLHWCGNFSLSMVIEVQFLTQIKFLQIVNVETDLWVKWFCHFPWKYNFLILIQIWLNDIRMDAHPYLLLNLGLICKLTFQHTAMKSNKLLAANCLTVDYLM